MNKTKSLTKILILTLAFLLTIALGLGLTGAWYNSRRTATGTITMGDGIIIEYSGFGQGYGEWQNNNASFLLFETQNNALPGTTVALNDAAIKAGTNSADFFARVKLEYKFFSDTLGETEITDQIADYSAFVNTPSLASGWVNSGYNDGYYYYATGTTFNTLPTADYVNIFTAGQSITLDGTAPGFNHQGGGYKYSNEILIKRIEVVLTLEAYQADATAAANAGWTILPPPEQYTDAAGVVYTQNQDETWTLTDGTALSSNSSSSTATYSARAFDSSYSYTILSTINNHDVVAIGDAAFLNASQLTSVEIPTTISTIGSRAFEGTGLTAVTLPQSVAEVGADALAANTLTEVTIENDQAVVTGIETAGIPTASVVNVPSAVLNDYETTLASYNGLRATAAAQIVLDAIVSDNMSYGAYMATDSDGNKWYFDLGSFIDMGYYFGDEVFLIWQNDNIDGTQARINYCRIGSNEYDQTILIPSSVRFNESVQTIDIVSMIGRGTSCIFSAFNRVSSVIIPSTILRIEDCAFFGCSNLSLVTIPDSVAFIGTDAFYGCTNLAFVSLPDSIIGVFFRAFKNCNSLKTMTIPASVIDGGIASSAFCGCTGLTKFISKNVNYTVSSDERCLIGSIDGINRNCLIAFAPCGVSTYEIPNTITFIGDNVFYGCVDLLNITIPNSVINLGSLCFGGCIGLTVVTFEDSGESRSSLYICSGAFQGCTSLTTVNWGDNWDGITVTVDNNAFVNCHPDLVVNIPNQD